MVPLAVESAHAVPVQVGWVVPFVVLLVAIAVAPFINRHWWEHNYPFVAFGLGAVVIR